MLNGEVKISCPNSLCNHEVSIPDIQSNLSRKNFEIIWDKLCDMYLWNTEDIRKWPNASCHNAGVILPKPCSSNLICDECHYEWRDATQYTLLETVYSKIFYGHKYNGELLSYWKELISGEPCPNWGIIISKVSGCPHMVCMKWKYEFWWDWLGSYQNYRHKGDTSCPLRVVILYPFFIYFLAMLNSKLWFSIPLIATIQKLVLFYTCMTITATLLLWSSLLEFAIFQKLKRIRKYRLRNKGYQHELTILSLFLYPILWVCGLGKLNI